MRYLVSPKYFRSLIKLGHNLSYPFWQVLVTTSALGSLQRKREISNEAAGSPGRNEKCLLLNIADRVLKL